MQSSEKNLKVKVEAIVAQIPKGRVMTYGQLAALCGNPQAARIVGGIAHFGNPALPWHRVVNKHGRLASGYPGGRSAHKLHLESEGVAVFGDNNTFWIEVDKLLWWPDGK